MNAEDTPPTDVAVAYGGFWRRVLAGIIDGIIFAVLNGLFHIGGGGVEAAGGLSALVGLLYEVGMTASRYQATIGKLALGLRVVDNEGRRLTFARSLGRWFAKILSALLFGIGFLMVAFTHRKRGLHDMLAGTLVLRMAPDTGPATKLPA
ncbi:MAG: RDD family protein [Alphaproteobacteria bacterium]|nr:RDD family protein [Alphaproteobacteria bacterium]